MSAPPSEVGSEVGRSVLIEVKAETTVEVDQAWLTGEFFEAPLKRWKPEDGSQARVSLLVPEGCDPAEGARLLKLRLSSEHQRKLADPESSAEARSWSCLDWWRATNGELSSLCTALHLFNFILHKDFAIEVANTLKLYRFRCPSWAARIAKELEVDVFEVKPPIVPLDIPFDSLKNLLFDAVKTDNDDLKILVERAIIGSSYSNDALMEALVEAYCSLFRWEGPGVIEVVGQANPKLPMFLELLGSECSQDWVLRLVEELVLAHSRTACVCHKAWVSRLKPLSRKCTVQRTDPNTGETSIAGHLGGFAHDTISRLRAICAHSLLLKSAKEDWFWLNMEEAFLAFVNLSCGTERYTYASGWVTPRPFLDVEVFAAANPEAQKLWLERMPNVAEFRHRVHLVHPSVRHFFLRDTSWLSSKDMAFLTSTDIPTSAGSSGTPQAKRQRQS